MRRVVNQKMLLGRRVGSHGGVFHWHLLKFGTLSQHGNEIMHADSSIELAHHFVSHLSCINVNMMQNNKYMNFHCSPMKGLFYCVIYLKPGDYHRVHAPADWNILVRRHFAGKLKAEEPVS